MTQDLYVKWRYDPMQTIYRQGGSGNNWALGYQYYGEESIYEQTSDLIRKQVESKDYFGGFQIIQSLAGGTGSGLGAHLVKRLREDYPLEPIINFSVWPYTSGEVILQNYNVLLTLSSLIEDSNAVVTVFNDQILTICRELLKNPRPSYKVLNQVIAQQMCAVLFPLANSEKSRLPLWSAPANIMGEITHTLCPQPQYKLLQLLQIP